MARQPLAERRAATRAKIAALKAEIAKMDAIAAERIGRLAVRAGLADLALDDDTLSREFEAIASRHAGAENAIDQADDQAK
ncbi:TraC family protein [Elioraea tepidiphila]|uniref:TraC family protein n=1 Tax=Elioraea tepidiphila TaxID=457934 RepID=UPI002FDB478D